MLRATAGNIRELIRMVRVGGNDGAAAWLEINFKAPLSKEEVWAKKYA